MDSQIGVLANQALNYLVSGQAPQRLGNAHPSIVPYEVFPVIDGHVVIAVGNDGQFRRLCEVLGEPALGIDPTFATNPLRVQHRGALIGRLAALTLRVQRDTLLRNLEAASVPAGPINTIAQAFDDPQVRHRRMQLDLPAASAAGGSIPGVRTPLVIDGVPAAHDRPSPRMGADEADILADPAWRLE
jgi:crotonobetainyl-CoA:carnitine CoA-transferase CaiB-like acyl-CoA transferase